MFAKDKTYGKKQIAVIKFNQMTGKSHDFHTTNEVKMYGKRQSAGKRHFMASWINRWRRLFNAPKTAM